MDGAGDESRPSPHPSKGQVLCYVLACRRHCRLLLAVRCRRRAVWHVYASLVVAVVVAVVVVTSNPCWPFRHISPPSRFHALAQEERETSSVTPRFSQANVDCVEIPPADDLHETTLAVLRTYHKLC